MLTNTKELCKFIANRLKTCRELLGLSRRQMANRLGIHYVTYCDWENGSIPNSMLIPFKIAIMSKMSLDRLFLSSELSDQLIS